MINFSVIVAVSKNRYGMEGIGIKNMLPWPRNPKDMAHFYTTTKTTKDPNKKNAIIMGRYTYESIGSKPLPGRYNCVITSNPVPDKETLYFRSLTECLDEIGKNINIESAFVIGGARLYKEAMKNKYCKHVIKTIIPGDYEADVYFPIIPTDFDLVKVSGNIQYYTRFYDNNSFEEQIYIEELKYLFNFGYAGAKIGHFGRRLEHSVRCINPADSNQKNYIYQFPIFTTHYTKPKNVYESALSELQSDSWRNYQGTDQLKKLVESLIIGCLYETVIIPNSYVQSYNFITTDGSLNCCLNVMSCDMYLEYPILVAKTALIMIIISRLSGYFPNKLVINIVDAYITPKDILFIKTGICKTPFRKPTLVIQKTLDYIDDIKNLTEFMLHDYLGC